MSLEGPIFDEWDALSIPEQRFIANRLKGYSKAKSYREAGFDVEGKNPGHVSYLAVKVSQRPRIRKVLNKISRDVFLEMLDCLRLLAEQATLDAADFFEERPVTDMAGNQIVINGEPQTEMVFSLKKFLASPASRHVEEVSWTKYGPKVKLPSRQGAIQMVMRYLGAFGPKGTEDDPTFHAVKTIEEWKERQNKALKQVEDTMAIFPEAPDDEEENHLLEEYYGGGDDDEDDEDDEDEEEQRG